MTRGQKRLILALLDSGAIFIGALYAAFLLQNKELSFTHYWFLLVAVMIFYLVGAVYSRILSVINRYTDYRAMFRLAICLTCAYLLAGLVLHFYPYSFNYRFLCLSWIFSILLTVGMRLLWREVSFWIERRNKQISTKERKRTLVIGAGAGADLYIRTALRNTPENKIVAIVDKDPTKKGSFLHGIEVVGTDNQIRDVVINYEISQVVIAIPSLTSNEYENLLRQCQEAGVKVTSMPKYEEVITGKLEVAKLRDIDITDLLGRKEVKLDQSSLESNLSGKTILVTGAGGSIGSEICRQVSAFNPGRLLLLGHGENSIYLIHRELKNRYGDRFEIIPLIVDIQDRDRIFQVMREYHPDCVYHAAAHKHVPLMEDNPKEAVKNNIFGTKNVAEAAKAAGVGKFVMISTDKAVNPPNVMGATKRVAEMIVTGLNEKGSTMFAAVRFGNVLGSRGSVVPVFKDQIAKGGPITVTDFRMTRYFMTIPEASRLVIQAGALMHGGEIFVLDMGEPVKIVDLAKKMILLSGVREGDIEIIESGKRPGEKLYEELLTSKELVNEQVYDHIFVGRVRNQQSSTVQHFIDGLLSRKTDDLKAALIAFAHQDS